MIKNGASFGYKIKGTWDWEERDSFGYAKEVIDKTICQYVPPSGIAQQGWLMPTEQAKELCQLMMKFFGADIYSTISIDDLRAELKRRGYSGTLEKTERLEI